MSFLSVILNCNQFDWGSTLAKYKESGQHVHNEILKATISLCNLHLFSSLNNQMILLAAGTTAQKRKKFIYESDNNQERQQKFTEAVEKYILDVLSTTNPSDDEDSTFSHYAGSISLSICAFQKFKKQFPNSAGKIVIINLADNLSSEQNVLMNLFFASRQHSLRVDVASLNGAVPILQQACDITGGVHMLITDYKLLAQELLANSFVDGPNLVFTRPCGNMDYRAVCHCHQKLVSIGWVCSVCLSVTCNFVPFCKNCKFVLSYIHKPYSPHWIKWSKCIECAIFPRPIYNQQKRPRLEK